jgi:hypothetical protein
MSNVGSAVNKLIELVAMIELVRVIGTFEVVEDTFQPPGPSPV